MCRAQGSKNVSHELKKKVIDMVGIWLTKRKVADYYSIPVSTVKSIVRRHRLYQISVVTEEVGWKCKLGVYYFM